MRKIGGDPHQIAIGKFGGAAFPRTIVIARDRRIVWDVSGIRDGFEANLRAMIESAPGSGQ